jgi:2,3-bisphosphoglycerate-dependent phosphoglycerate mutase
VKLYVISRHAHSTLNLERRINGDPSRPVPLTDQGREAARLLGTQVAHIPFDVCIHTRFPRTRDTAEIALVHRDVPLEVEPRLDDIRIGELEGATIDDYREVKRSLGRHEPFPGGESLDDAARRYATAYRDLLERPRQQVLVVCHEIPLRYALNAAGGSDDLDGPIHDIPNAAPFLFDEEALAQAAERIELLAG